MGGHGDDIRRFNNARIAEHMLVVFTVGILVATGLSQRFSSLDAARWVTLKLGGSDAVRLVHRLAGLVFGASMIVHIMFAAVAIILRKWRASMVITARDLRNAVHDIKYYIGVENFPAACDRYSYKQKFQYWGIFIGGLLMIGTGLLLWFPAFVTRFLPGEILPATKALHANEAMVIFLLIALWHIYNCIFSPEVFPLDTSIFTGYISRKRMIREHPIELARIEGVSLEEMLKQQAREGKEKSSP
jgi:cytochrome b subunit of formate dehydrogenase